MEILDLKNIITKIKLLNITVNRIVNGTEESCKIEDKTIKITQSEQQGGCIYILRELWNHKKVLTSIPLDTRQKSERDHKFGKRCKHTNSRN